MAPKMQFSELSKQNIKDTPKYLRVFKISVVMLANKDFQDNAQFQHDPFRGVSSPEGDTMLTEPALGNFAVTTKTLPRRS